MSDSSGDGGRPNDDVDDGDPQNREAVDGGDSNDTVTGDTDESVDRTDDDSVGGEDHDTVGGEDHDTVGGEDHESATGGAVDGGSEWQFSLDDIRRREAETAAAVKAERRRSEPLTPGDISLENALFVVLGALFTLFAVSRLFVP